MTCWMISVDDVATFHFRLSWVWRLIRPGEMHIVGLAFNLGSSSIGQQQQINQTQVLSN